MVKKFERLTFFDGCWSLDGKAEIVPSADNPDEDLSIIRSGQMLDASSFAKF